MKHENTPTGLIKKMSLPSGFLHNTFIILSYFVSWVIFSFIATAKPFYSLVYLLTLESIYFYLSRKSKLLIAVWVFSIFIALLTLIKTIPGILSENKCVVFGVSYPGTKAFEDCANALTYKDYLEAFKP